MRYKLLVLVLLILLASFITGCRFSNEPIIGKAIVVGFDYSTYHRDNVRFDVVVLGYTADGEEVTRRWRVSLGQFRQLEIGDTVRRIHNDVIRFE